MTLLEVLVVIAVLGLLSSILVPAVQSSRATARTVACRSNLRQLGTAVANAQSRLGRVAASRTTTGLYAVRLPYGLRQETEMMNAFTESGRLDDASGLASVWRCPSDTRDGLASRIVSYLPNRSQGVWDRDGGSVDGWVIRSDWPDGASQTALLSERAALYAERDGVPTARSGVADPKLSYWYVRSVHEGRERRDAFVHECFHNRTEPALTIMPNTRFGAELISRSGVGGYEHLMPPNSASCLGGPSPRPSRPPLASLIWSTAQATSHHEAAVNVQFADGRCESVSETVDLAVWRAIGTSRGGDVVGDW